MSESASVKVSSSDTTPEQSSNAESQLSAQLQTLIKVLYDEASDALKSELLAQVTNKGLETPLGILALKQIEKGTL
jgi:restriction endonuclease Mrr